MNPMQYTTHDISELKVRASVSAFVPDEGVSEYNMMLEGTDPSLSYAEQVENLKRAYDTMLEHMPSDTVPVFKRYFLSDPTNQAALLPHDEPCAVSVIGQAPLSGVKVALWVYLQTGMVTGRTRHGLWTARHGAYKHMWCGGACAPDLHSELATMAIFGDYVIMLDSEDCGLLDNCMRTWFFVRDIDVNYRGVVVGRNDVFRRSGLTPLTHFIASTGIAGSNADTAVSVTMDAYAVEGISQDQVQYLQASDFLNSTVEYGVAFERGTAITYGDRRHVLISGTASINNRGEVMYSGDVRKQTERMLQNVEALIQEADCDMSDITHLIIYLRDTGDYAVVRDMFDARFATVPRVIVQAPVCRPGWLIEVECMAIRPYRSSFAPL